jgi:hypothetical protein
MYDGAQNFLIWLANSPGVEISESLFSTEGRGSAHSLPVSLAVCRFARTRLEL